MSFINTLRTLIEIVMAIVLVWCIFNEDRLVAFEQRLISGIRRRRLRVVKDNRVHPYRYNN